MLKRTNSDSVCLKRFVLGKREAYVSAVVRNHTGKTPYFSDCTSSDTTSLIELLDWNSLCADSVKFSLNVELLRANDCCTESGIFDPSEAGKRCA